VVIPDDKWNVTLDSSKAFNWVERDPGSKSIPFARYTARRSAAEVDEPNENPRSRQNSEFKSFDISADL